MEPTVQQFKTGDRVQVKDRTVSGLRFWDSSFGKRGTITALSIDHAGRPIARVRFGEDGYDEGHPDNLTLIESAAPAPTHPQTITLDGVTYTLTPVQEAPAEEGREAQAGEVWRDEEGALYLITNNYGVCGGRMTVMLTGNGYANSGELMDTPEGGEPDTFAYPTLAAAIADGALS